MKVCEYCYEGISSREKVVIIDRHYLDDEEKCEFCSEESDLLYEIIIK